MKKIFLILLCLIASVCSAQPSHYGPYDPGAMRTGGVALAATGTAAAPAYSFGSDPNTGIYNYGADQVGFSVGGSSHAYLWKSGNYNLWTNPTTDGNDDQCLWIGHVDRSQGAGLLLYGNEFPSHNGAFDTYIGTNGAFRIFGNGGAESLCVIASTSNILIGAISDDGANKLQVNGNAYVNGSIRSTGNGAFGFGTAANPSIGFIDSNDGFYKLSADNFFAGINGTAIMGFDNNGVYMNNGVFRLLAKTPASATDTGITGTICFDSSYIYICTATNTWRRVAISSW